ncbi:MAG: hypothetical protein ABJP70_01325 [Erythrobacter sp.]
MKRIVLAMLAASLAAGCSTQADEQSDASLQATTDGQANLEAEWDGKTRQENDAIVTLQLPSEPLAILLNGDPATSSFDPKEGIARVLIPSEDEGILCENTFVVKFKDGTKGQLRANHCHGTEVFEVRPGETIDNTLTKSDVDSPENTEVSGGELESGRSLAFKWSANGFEQVADGYKWMGSSKKGEGFEPALVFSVPETDDTIWSAGCGAPGVVQNQIYINVPGWTANSIGKFRFETEKSPHTRVYKVRYDKSGQGTSIVWNQSVDDPMFAEMKAGGWAYAQIGEGDEASKLRLSLDNAAAALNAFLPACG